LIVTYGFWNNASNSDENFPSNITFKLTSFPNYTNFSLSDTTEGIQRKGTAVIVRKISMISSSSQNMLGDYTMKMQVIWQGNELTNSDVIIHVIDPLPTTLPVPGFDDVYFMNVM